MKACEEVGGREGKEEETEKNSWPRAKVVLEVRRGGGGGRGRGKVRGQSADKDAGRGWTRLPVKKNQKKTQGLCGRRRESRK